MSKFVFISYARPDVDTAIKIEEQLTDAGFRVFRDQTLIETGDNWDMILEQALKDADSMVLLLSSHSMPYRKEVYREWFFFDQQDKPIFPLYISECELHSRMYAYNYIDAREREDDAISELINRLHQPFSGVDNMSSRDRITFSQRADNKDVLEALDEIRRVVKDPDHFIALKPDLIREILEHPPRNIEEYHLARITEWSQKKYDIQDQFVNLTLLIDRGEDVHNLRWKEVKQFQNLRSVIDDQQNPALVVLGPPGSGKSTLLRRFQFDSSIKTLQENNDELTFLLQLNQFPLSGRQQIYPYDWLSQTWKQRYPDLPDFETLIRSIRVTVLLDGLNEIPHHSIRDYNRQIVLWRNFLQEIVITAPLMRVVFTCRSLDYSAPLSSPELRVPQIQIDLMDAQQMQKFIKTYAPGKADTIWNNLVKSDQFSLFRNPYYLKLLIEQVEILNRIPSGQAELFTRFVRQTLRREIEQSNPIFEPGHILLSRDLKRVTQSRWRTKYDLPESGPLLPGLIRLSYEMQMAAKATQGMQIRLEYDDALNLVEHEYAEDILKAGVAINVLDEDTQYDEILFYHQLLQEFFAARQMIKELNLELIALPWKTDEVEPSITDVLSDIAISDEIPPAPTTGWEETTLLAAALSNKQDEFVNQVASANIHLAGRCLLSPEVDVSPELYNDIVQRLQKRSQNIEADIRVRLADARLSGELGYPVAPVRKGIDSDYIIEELIPIEGKASVEFSKYPVTNKAYSYFIENGGYTDERWWISNNAKAWISGASTRMDFREHIMVQIKMLRTNPEYLDKLNDNDKSRWELLLGLSDDSLTELLASLYPRENRTQPALLEETRFNNPRQPVVGITCFEAQAYCSWLSYQTNEHYRLPYNDEWELVSKEIIEQINIKSNNAIPYNIHQSHIHQPSPIGIFPETATSSGIHDLFGNIAEWIMIPQVSSTEFNYGVRGGSWKTNSQHIGSSSLSPSVSDSDIGFRIVRDINNNN